MEIKKEIDVEIGGIIKQLSKGQQWKLRILNSKKRNKTISGEEIKKYPCPEHSKDEQKYE